MSSYKFENFRFDTTTYQLTQDGQSISLRPKTAQLLRLFLQNSDRVLSKAEITAAIWQSEHVQDHALFQLISELRKLPSQDELIRTQPNKGYHWIAPSKECKTSRVKPLSLSAGIAACILSALAVTMVNYAAPKAQQAQQAQSLVLPAIHAFSKGVIALENGDQDNAIAWFEFALTENPDSIETRLMLSESLFQQRRFEESIRSLQPLLSQNSISAYHLTAAQDLMSRIYQSDGQLDHALQFAQRTIKPAHGAQCTTSMLDKRLEDLKKALGNTQPHTTTTEETIATPDKPSQLEQDYIDRCNTLLQSPSEDDYSACIKANSPEFYAYAKATGNFITRC